MPNYKLNGRYWTPGGCSAWNGRTFTGAAIDHLCDITYLYFRRSGWYESHQADKREVIRVFRDLEDPGCWWNAARNTGLWETFTPIDYRLFASRKQDEFWDIQTGKWMLGDERSVEEWLNGCDIERP